MGHFFRISSLVVLALSALPARAEPLAPLNVEATYQFYLGAIPFGKMHWQSEEDTHGYDVKAQLKTTGLANIFVKWKINATAKGKDLARHYITDYVRKDKARHVDMAFDAKGALLKENLDPPNKAGRPPVPPKQKVGAYDPLTYLLGLRKKLATAAAKGHEQFDLLLYDGSKLEKTHAVIGEAATRQGGTQRVLPVVLTRTPIAGHTEKEIKKMAEEPPLTVLFSDDSALVPLELYADLPFGRVRAVMEPPKGLPSAAPTAN